MSKTTLIALLKSGNTVFSFKDILLTSGETRPALLRQRLYHYVKKGYLYPLRRGLYAKDKNYHKFELATKILTPSYVSFETILAEAGIIFQWYGRIFIASYQTKEIVCDNKTYSFKKIKDTVLTNSAGVENKDNFSVASKERAFLDTLYLNKEYHFDNLKPLDWDKVFDLVAMYDNQRMAKKVKEYYKDFRSDRTSE
ncbi:MAG: hypothetical protein HY073_04870 [Deltaproteobacteria bacterium]|nr:hypothetical protein [Deltaproteobacteria bacterium]